MFSQLVILSLHKGSEIGIPSLNWSHIVTHIANLLRIISVIFKSVLQATQELREYVKDPGVVPALCTVITSSQNVQVCPGFEKIRAS